MKRRLFSAALCLCLLAGLLSGCGSAPAATEAAAPIGETASEPESAAPAAAPEPEADAVITFTANGASFEGDGVEIDDDGEVDIESAGVYRVTGASDNGRIVVDAGETGDVTIVLAGCDLTYPDDEVIYFKVAGSATVVLAEGTENTLTSGAPQEAAADEADAEAADAEAEDASGAALRAKTDLTITGAGSLTVNGYINNGIAATGDLTVESGTLSITSVNDALKSRAALTVAGGDVSIESQADGVQADGSLTISGGALSVVTGVGAAAADMKVSDSLFMGGGMGRGGRDRASEETDESDAAEETADTEETDDASREPSQEGGFGRMPWDADDENAVSRKGLKSEGDIILAGGSVLLDTEDDAIHAAGNVELRAGDYAVSSGDDGVHADGALTISGGSITVSYCYEALEATAVTVTGGVADVTATDDGVNVNGGDFGPMRFGPSAEASDETEEETESVTPVLRITGGTVLIDSGGDGLDSNGDIYIEGGFILVSGPSSDWDAAVDYGDGGYTFKITGGVLMAGGYSGMAEAPDAEEDSQPSIYYRREDGGYCADGDTVTLLDADGAEVLSGSFAHSFNCVVLSAPELTVGETYTLLMGDIQAEISLDTVSWSNRASRGGFGGFGGFGSREMQASGEASAETETAG